MRQVIINGQQYLEEIQSYEHNVGNFIRVMVGIGTVQDDKFVFTIPQQYSVYTVVDIPRQVASITNEVLFPGISDYSDLITTTGGAITLESLWTAIDLIRSRQ